MVTETVKGVYVIPKSTLAKREWCRGGPLSLPPEWSSHWSGWATMTICFWPPHPTPEQRDQEGIVLSLLLGTIYKSGAQTVIGMGLRYYQLLCVCVWHTYVCWHDNVTLTQVLAWLCLCCCEHTECSFLLAQIRTCVSLLMHLVMQGCSGPGLVISSCLDRHSNTSVAALKCWCSLTSKRLLCLFWPRWRLRGSKCELSVSSFIW